MKLAFSTNAYLKHSFTEAVRRLAALGYAGVEVMADVPHAWPAFLLEEQKQAIRAALAANRLATAQFVQISIPDGEQPHPWARWAGVWKNDPDFDQFLANIAEYRRNADTAEPSE